MSNINNSYIFEICANSIESCLAAVKAGAHRIELCASMPEGGCTPSYGLIKLARELCPNIKLHVIIRSRGGDFLYNKNDLLQMQYDIATVKELGADGVVFGALDAKGRVDIKAMECLVNCAQGLSLTFHRAFDMCSDPMQALEDIIALKFNRILTSGLENNASDGAHTIARLIQRANNRIIIMPGCGINPQNIRQIASITKACEFHFSASTNLSSLMEYKNPKVHMGGNIFVDDYDRKVSSDIIIRQNMQALN